MNQIKVLVIDDEFPVRYLVEYQLKRNGFEAISAKDGPSGLEAAHAHKPDLIVLDIMMPKMNGFEVCEEIRKAPSISDIPVIFLTACLTQKHKLQAFESGADDYLVKPFQPDELLAHITAVLRRSGEQPVEEKKAEPRLPNKIVSFFSPIGGVGTTTLAVQLSEAIALRENRPVFLLDLDLPSGSIAPMLDLHNQRHIIDLLNRHPDEITFSTIRQHAQRHQGNMFVIPTPFEWAEAAGQPPSGNLKPLLRMMMAAGYQVILDLGSSLSQLTLEGLRQSDIVYVVTSGQPVANKRHNAFMSSAAKLGLQPQKLLPVINELHGAVEEVDLFRVPVARIPKTGGKTQTRAWLREQGMGKLMSVIQ
jgi:CheY-like chemotaxis protein/MinD-like ATPase involved in chromosome partitioning or flagellar assembly